MSLVAKARAKLKKMPMQQKVSLAPRSTPDLLELLLEESQPQITLAALDNPHITEKQVLNIVRSGATTTEVLEKIAQNKEFTRSVAMQLELIKNPKTPQSLSLELLKSLNIMDIMNLLGRTRELQPGLRQRMLDIFKQRISQAGEEQRVQMLGRGPSDVTQIIIELGGERVLTHAIRHNHLRQYHALRIARSVQSTPKILTMLFDTPPWGQQYEVRWALINNDNTPRDIRIKIFRSLPRADQERFRKSRHARGLFLS